MAGNSKVLLKQAVHQNKALGKSGVLERMFTAWFGGFFYNQIWEDPRVDREALCLNEESDVLCISSAGCNVMSYLVDSPGSITAVDLNQNHIYLTRLKVAAAQSLPTYDHFWRFFGCAEDPANLEAYVKYIRVNIDEDTRRFWEGGNWVRRKVLGPRIGYFGKNLYNHARLGYFLRFSHGVARALKRDPNRLLTAKTQEEQAEIFDEYYAPLFDHWFVKAIGRAPFFLFGIGIPPRQYEALKRETDGQLVEMYRDRVRKLACDYPVEDNYFAWQAFARKYDRDLRQAVPAYLKEANYELVKNGAARVRTEITTLHDFLGRQSPGTLDRFVFLDSQDWMKPEEIAALWAEIDRVGRPGTRIIFRTASSVSPIEKALPPDLMGRFRYEDELSKALHEKDRAAIYGGFHVYVKPE